MSHGRLSRETIVVGFRCRCAAGRRGPSFQETMGHPSLESSEESCASGADVGRGVLCSSGVVVTLESLPPGGFLCVRGPEMESGVKCRGGT